MSNPSHAEPSHVLASAAAGFDGYVAGVGADPDSILGGVGLSADDILDPTNPVALSTYCKLLELAAYKTRDDCFGLDFGRQFEPERLGLIGFVALASPTARTALANFMQLFPYHQNGTEARMKTNGNMVRLEYKITDPAIRNRRQDAEFTMSAFMNVIRKCLGNHWTLVRAEFEHPCPGLASTHHQVFDADVFFSRPTNALTLRAAHLDSPVPSSNPMLLHLMRSSLLALGKPTIPSDLVSRARTEIRGRLAGGAVALSMIANVLNVPTWTLQRRLADSGLSFSSLVDEVRRDLACVYINDRQISLTEISYLLGYSEPSAFSRAFRHWYGVSPRAHRKRALGSIDYCDGPNSADPSAPADLARMPA